MMNESYRLLPALQVGRTSESAPHLRAYPAYKDSGVPWLGDVPAHWDVLPHRALFREINERNHPDESLLSVTITRGVIPQKELLTNSSKKDSSNLDKSNYKLVLPGDITYNKMRAWQGALGASQYRGIVSPAYVVVRPRQQQVPEYYHYLLRTPGFIKEAERWSYGITSDMWSLRAEDFKRVYGVLPPLDEQRAIAAFLAHHDRLTRRYIHAQQRLIKLLTEQKQALIQQAVTRGLPSTSSGQADPDVPLKDSGIAWLGKIPAYWEIVSLGTVCNRIVDGPHVSPSYVDDGVMFISARNVKTDAWAFDDAKYISWEDYELFSQKIHPERGDVLYTKGGTTGVARAIDFDQPFQVWVHIAVLKIRKEIIDPFYLAYALNSPRSYEQSQLYTRGATNQDLGLNRMSRIRFCLPPLDEQRLLVHQLDRSIGAIQETILHTHRQIALVREYRTRLIADVVTGKLDVRGFEVGRTSEGASHLDEYDDMDDTENGESVDE